MIISDCCPALADTPTASVRGSEHTEHQYHLFTSGSIMSVRRKLSGASWSSARKAVLGRRENVSDATLSGAGPELCISLLRRGLNFSGLEARLSSVDQHWIEEFLAANGLSALIEAVQVQSKKGFSSITDVLRQLECVRCVKSVISNRRGLEFLVQSSQEKVVQRLILGIPPQIRYLCTFFCMY